MVGEHGAARCFYHYVQNKCNVIHARTFARTRHHLVAAQAAQETQNVKRTARQLPRLDDAGKSSGKIKASDIRRKNTETHRQLQRTLAATCRPHRLANSSPADRREACDAFARKSSRPQRRRPDTRQRSRRQSRPHSSRRSTVARRNTRPATTQRRRGASCTPTRIAVATWRSRCQPSTSRSHTRSASSPCMKSTLPLYRRDW